MSEAHKLQVVEPMKSGHHSNYLLALIPSIQKLKASGLIRQAVFTVTQDHFDLLQKAGEIERAGATIDWDPTLVSVSPAPSFAERETLFESLRRAVADQRPSALVCTTADYDVVPNALARLKSDSRYWPAQSAAMLHFGLPKEGLTTKENIKRVIYETAWKFSNWNKLLIVNPLCYDSLLPRLRPRDARYGIVPDPVPPIEAISRSAARQALNLPVDGNYVGSVGIMDHRKAIPELLEAFVQADLGGTRLLLAGQLDPSFRALIDRRYRLQVEQQKILVLDRRLSDAELSWGYAALDLHSVLQYRRFNLSANALKCVAYGTPFLCDKHGFAPMLADRARAGIICDVTDVGTIVSGLQRGLGQPQTGAKSKRAEAILEFHSYRNFAATTLRSVLGPEVERSLGDVVGWQGAYASA